MQTRAAQIRSVESCHFAMTLVLMSQKSETPRWGPGTSQHLDEVKASRASARPLSASHDAKLKCLSLDERFTNIREVGKEHLDTNA